MADLRDRVIALAQGIAGDVKKLFADLGDPSNLTTSAKGSTVAAINELKTAVDNAAQTGGAAIDDAQATTATTYSSAKIETVAADAANLAKSEILGGAGPAFDTLTELKALIDSGDAADQTAIANITTAVSNRVRYDAAQSLSEAQKTTACSNIGIGPPDTDFLASYTAARDS